jgi:hypothetical protein
MHSASAADVTRRRIGRLSAMTPDERIALVERLREEGLASYMETHGVDRTAAVAQIKAARRLGRRRSASAEADAH